MRLFSLLAALTLALPAGAQTIVGDLRIEAPMLRATPPAAPVAGGFLIVENTGGTDDTLTAAAIAGDIAAGVQFHRMSMSDGVMTMAPVEDGVPIPGGRTVTLAPGGLHLMLMGLAAPLEAGDHHEITLTFATAGEVTVDFPVRTLGEIRAATEKAGVGDRGMGMDHDMKQGSDADQGN